MRRYHIEHIIDLFCCTFTPIFMEAVANQKTDVPYDSENPLFRFGFGIKYIK